MSKDDELQKAILNNIPDQAWLKDKDSRYILVNDAFIAACRLPESEILNKTPLDVWPADWGREYIDTDKRVMEQGERLRYEEWRYTEDGTLRWYDTIKTPIRNEQGEVIGTTGISRDITDRKLAEEDLLESRSQLRELSAYLQSVREEERTRISRELHDELGQSLTAIRIGLSVIETRREMQDDEWLQNVHALKKIADSTVESVQRIAADLRPLILDELGLPSAIDWLLESFAKRNPITYELSLPSTPLAFSRDISTAIFRILQESLTNVSRHSRATSVVVALKETKGVVTLKVTDNGQGFDHVSSREDSLGLIGMRERAFMLGGKLKIQSRLGSGTSIEVRIPKVAASDSGDGK
ncbi:PAS domain-containing sensor histidine kinase [Herminiimonas arsenitoxidans]|uniref:PAS domain-containing sensor histidine kinase n=1 Tax=Herminiimonas arsenitoxidans TaxID=1809410 RepID=UPI00097066DD|nr:PAS domain-containing protein [Herminiimonas arsenitoxidans]